MTAELQTSKWRTWSCPCPKLQVSETNCRCGNVDCRIGRVSYFSQHMRTGALAGGHGDMGWWRAWGSWSSDWISEPWLWACCVAIERWLGVGCGGSRDRLLARSHGRPRPRHSGQLWQSPRLRQRAPLPPAHEACRLRWCGFRCLAVELTLSP